MAQRSTAQRVGCLPLLVAFVAGAVVFGVVLWLLIRVNASPQLVQIVATGAGVAVAVALVQRARQRAARRAAGQA